MYFKTNSFLLQHSLQPANCPFQTRSYQLSFTSPVFRDSQNRNPLWGASHPEGLLAEIHERIRTHLLRGFLQGAVRPAWACQSLTFERHVFLQKRLMCFFHITNWSFSIFVVRVWVFTRRFAGRPGNYVYVFNDYRMEEVCYPTLYLFSSLA